MFFTPPCRSKNSDLLLRHFHSVTSYPVGDGEGIEIVSVVSTLNLMGYELSSHRKYFVTEPMTSLLFGYSFVKRESDLTNAQHVIFHSYSIFLVFRSSCPACEEQKPNSGLPNIKRRFSFFFFKT